ncbi:hypothetical protein GCM10010112_87050 [Actinoplanes lobatus]|uniref:Phage portal protein BeeE n=1 Tax=Actinoplanes lobatus TaxID=113568 RepID=A0A7W7HC19_9ACTN|nr:phage portal protein [Actinoplanes lobatus]MBB4747758.1 phage portal protein BeeE [Actinoplanes lobatus]GGN96109.1 hypothetical protein GCM10010112_87050 [Actinoplanes lobatus]GIE45169.1 hypothetical protein Alo02nite_80670 [Actinoplanes lobatus]
MALLDRLRKAYAARRTAGADRRAGRQAWAGMFQTYGEPNAERIVSSYVDLAEKAYAGNAVVFGVALARMSLFTEARVAFRSRADRKLSRTPALERLEKPWPNGTLADLLGRMEQDATLAGNAYIRDAGDQLERLRPDWVTIVSEVDETDDGHQIRRVLGFVYDPVGDPDRDIDFYAVDEVAHWAPIPDPLAFWRGMSWLTPVVGEINADKAMTAHRETFFKNAATPNMVIKYTGKLTREQAERIGDRIAARHAGPGKAGRTLILDEGADLQVVGAQLRDVQFDELQSAGENRVAVAGQVPAIVAGLKEGLDSAAWSMYRQALRRFADQTMRPLWRSAFAALAVLVDVPDGAELWFDVSDIAALQESEQEAAQTAQTNAATLSTLLTAGFTAESAVAYVASGDLSLLDHSGLYSVQLRPPGEQEPAPAGSAPAPDDAERPAAPADAPGPADTDEQDADDDPAGDMRRAWPVDELDFELEFIELLRGWEPNLHPRDHRGRFRKVMSSDVGENLFPLTKPSTRRLDQLVDDFGREENPDDRAWQPIVDEYERREAEENARNDRISAAVDAGDDYLDAYAREYGLDAEKLRHKERMSLLDAERFAGETRRQAVRRLYDEWIYLRYLKAEAETRGIMVTKAGFVAGIDPISLFSGPPQRARKWASEELMRWWADNGRVTFTEFAFTTYGIGSKRAAESARLSGNGRDFGV